MGGSECGNSPLRHRVLGVRSLWCPDAMSVYWGRVCRVGTGCAGGLV
jgi:hypothetical protein